MKRRAWVAVASVMAAFDAAAQVSHEAQPLWTRFDTRLLRGDAEVDLSRFERGDVLAPGLHSLDIVRNGEPLGRRLVRFANGPAATACFDTSLADAIGLALHALSPTQRAPLDDPKQCVAISSLAAGARADYVAEALALHVTLPQASLVHRARDAVDPALRDTGIPAFRINYAFNGLHDQRADGADTRASARIELGANLARWRWRHRATHTLASDGVVRSNTLSSTLERDVDAFDAQLTLGDFHTSGVLFDTVGLRGVRLASDDRMLPPSMLRYAPVVRGVAHTNARVQVRQSGALLYDTMVAPGPFALRDVQPLGIGGALDVQVIEADGQVTTFAVPYAAVPGLLRAGHARFSLTAGRWLGAAAQGQSDAKDIVFQGTVQQGVLDRVTVHAGAQLAPDYAQALGGVAVSTRAGAFSFDRAQSRWAPSAETLHGHAWRVAYAGRIAATGTQVDVAAWRHGSDGFRSLGDAMRGVTGVREHTRTDASLRHLVGHRGGAVTLGLVDRTWRAPLPRQRSLRVGWGVALRGAGLLQATLEQGFSETQQTTTGTLSLSLPFDVGTRPALLHAHARALDNQTLLHASGSGAFGNDRRHAWGGGMTHAMQPGTASTTTTSATVGTQGRAGQAAAGLSASRHVRQWSANAAGSVLLHAHGATFGMPLGDTVALVRAPRGAGATLVQQPSVRLDRSGRAVVPQLSPYRRNTVGVDPASASRDVQFDWTERSVVPRAGAVLDVVLPTTHAPLRRLRIVRTNGHPVPFAAEVRDALDAPLGTVGRDGIALLRVPTGTGTFHLHWVEAGEARRCGITLPATAAPAALPPDTPCTE